MMDYPCGKFGDCSFSCFELLVLSCWQTHTHTDVYERFTHSYLNTKIKVTVTKVLVAATRKTRFTLPELTARVDGWPVSITRQHWPCWRVMETDHPSTRVMETGLKSSLLRSEQVLLELEEHLNWETVNPVHQQTGIYRLVQLKWFHLSFLLVTVEFNNEIKWFFVTYKLHKTSCAMQILS